MKTDNKIFISIGTLSSGGAERVVCDISSMYCDYFREVVILAWMNSEVYYSIDKRVRVVCVERECGMADRLQQACWVRGFVKKERPDVFLSFLMPFNMMSIVTLAFSGIRIVVCERQDPSRVKTPMMRALRNLLYHHCDRIEVQTTEGRDYFAPDLRRKTFVIPNPNHITLNQRQQVANTHKENRIVTVGRLIPLKNHNLLIDAFAEIYRQYPDWRLDIYGDGELRQSLQNKIHDSGLTGSIHLCGRTTNVCDSIGSARIFVLSSDVEGMPNALMEAMALGIPCVATDVSGVKDMITDGENGFVVPIGDRDTLVEKMSMLIESKELQQCFSNNSIAVFEKFDKEKVFRQWRKLVTF